MGVAEKINGGLFCPTYGNSASFWALTPHPDPLLSALLFGFIFWGENFLVSHIQFHIQTGWLGVPSEADGERCWIDMCRWCDLWHRVVVPTLIRHQMLARYLVYGLRGPFLSQRTHHNSGITHHPPFHSPLYRLALVVLLTSPSTQK